MTNLGRIDGHSGACKANQGLVAAYNLQLLRDSLFFVHVVEHVVQLRDDTEHVLLEEDYDVLFRALSSQFWMTEMMDPLQCLEDGFVRL